MSECVIVVGLTSQISFVVPQLNFPIRRAHIWQQQVNDIIQNKNSANRFVKRSYPSSLSLIDGTSAHYIVWKDFAIFVLSSKQDLNPFHVSQMVLRIQRIFSGVSKVSDISKRYGEVFLLIHQALTTSRDLDIKAKLTDPVVKGAKSDVPSWEAESLRHEQIFNCIQNLANLSLQLPETVYIPIQQKILAEQVDTKSSLESTLFSIRVHDIAKISQSESLNNEVDVFSLLSLYSPISTVGVLPEKLRIRFENASRIKEIVPNGGISKVGNDYEYLYDCSLPEKTTSGQSIPLFKYTKSVQSLPISIETNRYAHATLSDTQEIEINTLLHSNVEYTLENVVLVITFSKPVSTISIDQNNNGCKWNSETNQLLWSAGNIHPIVKKNKKENIDLLMVEHVVEKQEEKEGEREDEKEKKTEGFEVEEEEEDKVERKKEEQEQEQEQGHEEQGEEDKVEKESVFRFKGGFKGLRDDVSVTVSVVFENGEIGLNESFNDKMNWICSDDIDGYNHQSSIVHPKSRHKCSIFTSILPTNEIKPF